MAFDFTYEGSSVVGAAEYSMPGDTTLGVPIGKSEVCQVQIWVNIPLLTSGDEYVVRVYEQVAFGDTAIVIAEYRIAHPVKTLVTSGLILHNEWDITIQKVSGTDRTVYFSVRRVT